MRIDPITATVTLSVGELASFRHISSYEFPSSGPWRAAVGQRWHEQARKQTQSIFPDARFEVPVETDWRHRRWTFRLRGRIDQIIRNGNKWLIREVKTVRTPLPTEKQSILENHSNYISQAAAYLSIIRQSQEFSDHMVEAQLQLINIDDGTVQNIDLDANDETRFEAQLDTLLPYLEDRRLAKKRLDRLEIKPAFNQLRPGQSELKERLKTASLESKCILLEAPTGFGKTGIALEHALQSMQSGEYQRCIYLTSKSTGQWQAVQQIQSMAGTNLRYIQMRNRKEHRIHTPAHTCTADTRCDHQSAGILENSGIYPPELFSNGTFSVEQARQTGAQTGLCPYSLTRACLPFAEIWVGDSNYIFAPASRPVFCSAAGVDPSTTLLIVDEAHNLSDRTANALSTEIRSTDLHFALDGLREAGASRQLLATGYELINCIDSINTTGALNSNDHYNLLDLTQDFHRTLSKERLNHKSTAPFAFEIAWSVAQAALQLEDEASHHYLHWSPAPGVIRNTCLDSSEWIAACLQEFSGSILMSATLAPYDDFKNACGLQRIQPALARGDASWRNNAYTVALDCRVDTRFRERKRYYQKTAETVVALIGHSRKQPVAVFFASYQYAEAIKVYLETIEPGISIALQKKGADLGQQAEFIEQSLISADAIFLILGSGYAEGIDQLGGQISSAMIVGPALAEVNAVQEARIENDPSRSRNEAFSNIYIIPAIRRIHQALGRLVRAPGQQARILLHGKRFAQTEYFSQLAPEYRSTRKIQNTKDLLNWLETT